MPSYLDLGVIGIVLVSALLAMVRGFTREVLAIASWVVAGITAYYFFPVLLPYVKQYIQKDLIAMVIAIVAVFIVTLIVISIVTIKISDLIMDSKIGALDRSLGFVFGAFRGLLIAVIAFGLFEGFAQGKIPEWVTNAKSRPFLEASAEWLKSQLPADLPEQFNNLANKFRGAPQAPPQDNVPNNNNAPPPADNHTQLSPIQRGGNTTRAAAATPSDAEQLNNLLAAPTQAH
ncbi:CvpA family protein [Methylovirgula sp. 4M-Z18]|uniref:CvpA family protein n=1 Tax=Methylovirgula sp. 4M-Z18 TaxID=2293567 RepID=UPI000E2FAFC4|nr:CvpA family protein [Methylovirgula sp. 4M-Z18]RFB80696.1 CvpA family protein [Methylovirgula sp. 4M-Z18]